MYCKIYINVLLYLWLHKDYIIIMFKKGNQHTNMQIRHCFECQWGMSMNANKEMLAGYADPDAGYPDADPDAT